MTDVLSAVLPLYALIMLGLGAGQTKPFRGSDTVLNSFVYWFALPAFLFNAVAMAPDGAGIPWPFFAVAFGVTFGFSAVVWFAARMLGRGQASNRIALAAGYGNVGYIAFPVILSVLGEEASLAMALAATVHNLIFLVGYPILSSLGHAEPGKLKQAILQAGPYNPTILSVIFGAVFLVAGWEVPPLIATPITLVAQSVIPVALFSIGVVLGPAIRSLLDGGESFVAVLLTSLLKIVVLPLITWAIAPHVVPDPTGLLVPVLVFMGAMPTGASVFTLSKEFDEDGKFAAAVVALSTLLALVTVTVVGALLV